MGRKRSDSPGLGLQVLTDHHLHGTVSVRGGPQSAKEEKVCRSTSDPVDGDELELNRVSEPGLVTASLYLRSSQTLSDSQSKPVHSRILERIRQRGQMTLCTLRAPVGLALNQVPEDFHEPFILSGYRFHDMGAYQSLKSAFLERNNEAINVWTHFLPSVYFLWRFYGCVREAELSDAYFLPWCLYCVTLVAYPALSSFAHALSNMSLRARHICFFVDYIGCSWYSLGAAVLYQAYSLPEEMVGSIFDKLFLWVAVMNGILSTIFASSSRLMKRSAPGRKTFRLVAFAVPYLYDSLPLFYRLATSHAHPEKEMEEKEALRLHSTQFLLTFIAVLFYSFHIPERIIPGRFDLIGHSHQIFHLATALASCHQMEASWIDLKHRRPLLNDEKHWKNVEYAWWAVWFVLLADLLVVAYFIIKVFRTCSPNKSDASK